MSPIRDVPVSDPDAITARHVLWAPLCAMLAVLFLTWLVVPQDRAPFVYAMF